MFYFAYDGSINGDWVSHYAAQLAAAGAERSLTERFLHGNVIEQALRSATCDVAVYRGIE